MRFIHLPPIPGEDSDVNEAVPLFCNYWKISGSVLSSLLQACKIREL